MERNQQILDRINNLEQQIDLYAIENWEFLRKSLVELMIMSIMLNCTISNLPYIIYYNSLLNDLAVYFSISIEILSRKNYKTLNIILDNVQNTFLSQNEIFPNITNKNNLFEKAFDMLMQRCITFFSKRLNLLTYDYINTQGIADLSFHFEFNDYKNLNVLSSSDYNRSKNVDLQQRRFMSNFQIATFYNRRLLKTETLPNEKILLYWIAFDNLVALSNDEKTKLAQLLSIDDIYLTEEQINLKNIILYDSDFQTNVITIFITSFQPWPKDGITKITLENINDNLPDKNHVIYILHAPEENLTELEKQFKIIFLGLIQEIYAQFYKDFYKVDELPNDKLLTKEQIEIINTIPSKVIRSSLNKYNVSKLAKNFFNGLNSYQINISFFQKLTKWFEFPSNIDNTNETLSKYINDIMQNPVNLSEKNQKAIERINEIKKLTFLYNPEENFPDSLTNEQETALIDLYNLCAPDILLPSITKEEKIESLKYTKENDEFFYEYTENPKFTGLDENIKAFIIYKEDLNYDTECGLAKKFNDLPDSKSIDISQYLTSDFKTLIENFNPKLPSDEKLNTELENLFENTFNEIEEQDISFEEWRPKHQEEIINEITQENWPNFYEKGNGFLKAVYNGELNIYLNDENAVKILSLAITAKLSCYPKYIKYIILIKFLRSKNLSPQIKIQLCIDNNITKKKYWPKILGIIAGITLGILGIGIALATGGIGTSILGMIGTIIASHTAIFATIASIGIAIGAIITGIFSKKVNEDKSINSIINLKSKNGYILLNPDEISNAQENLSNDMNESQKTSLNGKFQNAKEASEEQRQPNLDNQTQKELNQKA